MKCLYCKDVDLEITDSIDIDNEYDFIMESVIGYCPKCEKEFLWNRFYNFNREGDIEEM